MHGKKVDYALVAELHQMGKTDKQIAQVLECRPETISQWRRTNGWRTERRNSGVWNDDNIELLKKLWKDGLSASQIAARIGGITRNAVISKVHRLGLSGRVTPTRVPVTPRKQRPPRQATKPRASAMLFKRGPSLPPEPLPVTEDLVIPLDQRKGILDLKENDCRWPIGDPKHTDFHFCGHAKKASLPYCEFHAAKAYRQPVAVEKVPFHQTPTAKIWRAA